MDIRRKIGDDIVEELEDLMTDAEDLGHSFIELRYSEESKYLVKLRGRESLAIISTRKQGTTFRRIAGGKIVNDGVIRFYPDKKAKCWGYMLDTENNRLYLAHQLHQNHVIIVDSKIKKEIFALAKKLGIETEVDTTDHTFDGYLNKNKKVEEVVEEKVEEVVESAAVRKIRLEAELKILDLEIEPKKKVPLRPAKRIGNKSNK